MKIKNLRLKNLNSLVGEWSIDFEAPEYVSDGIFAITGPTGSGKSTIMDAICLALYGRTPRISSISQNNNEIMSRQTGDCFSELIFEAGEGRYMAYWSQRRARGKADGRLQQPKHELSNAQTTKILTSQLRSTQETVEKITGMDYDRFVQSMMLAQGGFAAFLQAKGDERAPILEQITGTAIYSEIGKYVFEKQRDEKNALETLQAEMRGIAILNQEEEEQLRISLEEKNTLVKAHRKERDRLDSQIRWLKTIADIQTDMKKVAASEAQLSLEMTAFEANRQKLLEAKLAAEQDGSYAELSAARKAQADDRALLENREKQSPGLKKQLEEASVAFDVAAKQHATALAGHQKLLKTTRQVRLVDQDIRQKMKTLGELEQHLVKLKKEAAAEEKKKAAYESQVTLLAEEITAITVRLEKNSADANIERELAGIRNQTERLSESLAEVRAASERLNISSQSLNTAEKKILETDKALAAAEQAHEEHLGTIKEVQEKDAALLAGRSPDDLREEKERLLNDLAELKQIAGFEESREHLEDGKACPLCGATEHPFAKGNVPSPTATDLRLAEINKILDKHIILEKQLQRLSEKTNESQKNVFENRTRKQLAEQQRQNIATELSGLENALTRLQATFNSHSGRLLNMLDPFGIVDIPQGEKGIKKIIGSLTDRMEAWKSQESRKNEVEKQLSEIAADIRTLERLTKEKLIEIKRNSDQIDFQQHELDDRISKRQEMFGTCDADAEEKRSAEVLEAGERFKEKASEKMRLGEQQLRENASRISELEDQIVDRAERLAGMESDFTGILKEAGFFDEQDFLAKRLDASRRKELEQRASELDSRYTALEARRKDREEQLKSEKAKSLTEEAPELLEQKLLDSQIVLDEATRLAGALQEQLNANATNRQRSRDIITKIEAQQTVYERWQRLNALIGSADGKKYRNFAQGLTLEVMVMNANRQLRKLSDRYLLIRDSAQPLELNVADNYQAGEIRSTKNLSGGESFIVSLALALGLSGMSSGNISVDSLFLDEGFGTLDEDALETALTTLADLRQEGKMIGVISHVAAIKERINTQIKVQPVREGRSTISGPGCK
jgi:DNA repair protein SbcC/Rad50